MTLPTVTVLLSRLGRLNEALVHEVCRRHGTTPAELQVLAMLRHKVVDGPVSPTHLARSIAQTSGGLTATLGRLQARGLIERSGDATDGRKRVVELTDGGAEFHDRVFAALVARYEVVLGSVDLEPALRSLRQLVGAFEENAGLASSAPLTIP